MATVTIRNLDDGMAGILKRRARAHDRSLEADLRAIPAGIARGPGCFDLRAPARRIAAMTPGTPGTGSAGLVRGDRGR